MVLDYETFADDIALQSGGIPERVILQFIPMSVQDFASGARTFTELVELDMVDGKAKVPQDDDMEVIIVDNVALDGTPLSQYARRVGLHTDRSCWYSDTVRNSKGGIDEYIVPMNAEYTPESKITALVAYAPTRNATSCHTPSDGGIFIRGVTAIILARLYGMPQRPWTDEKLAATQYSIYADQLTKAKRWAKGSDTALTRECKFSW